MAIRYTAWNRVFVCWKWGGAVAHGREVHGLWACVCAWGGGLALGCLPGWLWHKAVPWWCCDNVVAHLVEQQRQQRHKEEA